MGGVRRAAVAGTWYPGTAEALAAEIDHFGAGIKPVPVEGRLVALISPHAGLRYSGGVAAHAYALLKGRTDATVVLVGPSHRVAFDGFAVWAAGGFESPLGVAPIDEDLAAAFLAACPSAHAHPGPHTDEHSLEMQLPFLQEWVPGLRLLPILMADQGRGAATALASGLAAAIGRRDDVVLVASSDLSHYQPARIANRLDAAVVADVAAFDPDALMDRLERAPGHACGGGPMVAVMKAARSLGATRAHVLHYADSGDAGERNKDRVVGYLAAALIAS
jgi:AmmeMemoRadiSam system protein B